MDQYVINIPDDRRRFFAELLRNLPWIEVETKRRAKAQDIKKPLTPAQQEWVDELKESIQEAEAGIRGEVKLRSAWELAEELQAILDKQWPDSK